MTPQVPPHIQIAMARRELALLTKQRDVAAESIEALSSAMAALSGPLRIIPETVTTEVERHVLRLTFAISMITSVRLLELQMSHENLVARCAELEAALKVADGGIVIPSMRVRE